MRDRWQSVYLLGSEPGVAADAAERLHRWYPPLDVAGTHHGYFELGSEHDERVIEDINARRPDIVLVGMGSPKQELWVQRNAHRVDTDVLWTVGALFDYVSGRVPRAPAWLADNGLEWIFRLAIEPQRMWRRYLLGNPVFVSRVMAQAPPATHAVDGRPAGPPLRRLVSPALAGSPAWSRWAWPSAPASSARRRPGARPRGLAAIVLFGVAGFGLTRLLLPAGLRALRGAVGAAGRRVRRARSR